MATQMKRHKFKSPKGIASYAYLNTPDTAFNQDGIYTTKLRIANDNAQSLVEEIKQIAEENFGSKATNARMPYKIDEETGEVVFTVKSNYKPRFYDTTGRLLPEAKVPTVPSGSKIIVKGNINPYQNNGAGISLQMNRVQIIDLQEIDMEGFDAEEGSFIASNNNDEPASDGEDYNF